MQEGAAIAEVSSAAAAGHDDLPGTGTFECRHERLDGLIRLVRTGSEHQRHTLQRQGTMRGRHIVSEGNSIDHA